MRCATLTKKHMWTITHADVRVCDVAVLLGGCGSAAAIDESLSGTDSRDIGVSKRDTFSILPHMHMQIPVTA